MSDFLLFLSQWSPKLGVIAVKLGMPPLGRDYLSFVTSEQAHDLAHDTWRIIRNNNNNGTRMRT